MSSCGSCTCSCKAAVSCGTRMLDLWPIDKGCTCTSRSNMQLACILFVLLQCLGPLDQFQHSMEPQLRQLRLDTTLKKGNFRVLVKILISLPQRWKRGLLQLFSS